MLHYCKSMVIYTVYLPCFQYLVQASTVNFKAYCVHTHPFYCLCSCELSTLYARCVQTIGKTEVSFLYTFSSCLFVSHFNCHMTLSENKYVKKIYDREFTYHFQFRFHNATKYILWESFSFIFRYRRHLQLLERNLTQAQWNIP